MQAEAVAAARGAGRMAAWRVHAYGAPPPAELRLDAARVPPLRAPADVRVRVHHSSINPLDLAMTGGYGARVLNALRALQGEEGGEFPLVPGRDFVGEVCDAGPAARLRRGARVWGVVPPQRPGAHADYVVLDQRWVGLAPRALGAEAGGALFAALSASAALRAAGVWGGAAGGAAGGAGGARVLLLGLGGVGRAALQLLRLNGVEVVVGCSGEACAEARALGATALDRRASGYERALLDAGPYEAIIDCAGLGGGEAGARRWRFKRYVTLSSPLLRETDARGLLAGGVAAAAQLAAQCARAASGAASDAASGAASACPPHVRWAYFVPRADDIELLRRLAERGQFSVAVERVFGWRDARAAYECAARGARGKLLLDFTDDAPPGAARPGP